MSEYKAELERRRERGRVAQSTFRQRQALAKQAIRNENAALKQAIKVIASEVRPDDRLILQQRIQEALLLAGADTDTQNMTIPMVETNGAGITSPSAEQQGYHLSRSHNRPVPKISSRGHVTEQGWEASLFTIPELDSNVDIARDPFQRHRCNNGVATVLPFLGNGAFTVAGRIFWHLVKKFEATKHDSRKLLDNSVAGPPRFGDLLEQSKVFQHIEPTQWVAMIDARLDYRDPQLWSDEPAANQVANQVQNAEIVQGDVMSDGSSSKWLSPMSAETRIRAIVGDDVFAILASPVLECRDKTRATYVDHHNNAIIDNFLDRLSESFICFGDGPRWARETFDEALRDWCHSIINPYVQALISVPIE